MRTVIERNYQCSEIHSLRIHIDICPTHLERLEVCWLLPDVGFSAPDTPKLLLLCGTVRLSPRLRSERIVGEGGLGGGVRQGQR